MNKLLRFGFVLAMGVFAACGGDDGGKHGPGDTSDCVDAFLCAADCTSNACVESCMNDVGETVKQQMIALAVCSEESGCGDGANAEECLRDHCGDELKECGL